MSGFTAGTKLRASFIRVLGATATGPLQPTSTLQDIPGATVTFSVAGANAFIDVTAFACFIVTAADTGKDLVVSLVVDGVAQGPSIVWPAGVVAPLVTPGQTWPPIAVAAGSHTVKLQGRNDGTSNSARTIGANLTTLNVRIYDVP